MTYLNKIHVQEIEPSFIEMNYSQWHIWIETYMSMKIEPSFIEMNYSQWHIWIRHTCPGDRTELYRDELFTMTYLNRDIHVQEDRTELYRDELFTMTYLNRDIRVQKIEPSFIEMNYSQWHIWIRHTCPGDRTELYRDERVQKIEPSFIEMNYSQWHIWIETYMSRR